jgi:hypothetical protein
VRDGVGVGEGVVVGDSDGLGSYPGGNGTTLQVQRREGGSWAAFPTSATVDDGTFRTYVESGQPGPNAFRVVDPARGQASNVVVFTVS